MIETANIVAISDTHCGCRLAICPPPKVGKVKLDDGGSYVPSTLQRKIYSLWEEFWNDFVPDATRGEPYSVIFNGDAVDGVHHNSTTQVSHNLTDQKKIAKLLLRPIVDKCEGRYYHIRGTEAHVGKSAKEEEELAEALGAVPNNEGQYARYDLWKRIGPRLIHALHHIGTTGSQAYEATAVGKEIVEEFTESGRWKHEPPDVVLRSHRHRYCEVSFPVAHPGDKRGRKTGKSTSVVTPAWQGKTPFVWKIAGARLATPQFGGIVIRWAHDELFIRSCVWTVGRSKVE